ncbi:MAG: lytic transglycosylase domain-containing protein [Chromatiales bacterium]|nr:MAG: lytic transglycosylase domain-containing protein [Chromatiales bacterium]
MSTRRRRGASRPSLWPRAQTRRRWWRRWGQLPTGLQVFAGLLVLGLAGLLVNVTYQVIRKPTELFFPVSGTLYKTPTETWREYAPIFIKHSTATITPEFLAALAQIEASGNPVVRTYWRFSLRQKPLNVYRPASSAVGMYQITDGTFEETRRFCIHNHVVVEDGPWNKPRSCWFNWLYFRVVPSHAVEMTAAYLDRKVAETLRRHRIRHVTPNQKLDVATLTHLCGAAFANGYVRRGLQIRKGQRCGDHDPRAYLARVRDMTRMFRRLSVTSEAQ